MVRIASCQLYLDVTNPSSCLRAANSALEDAIKGGAKIIVLPELSNSGYAFESVEEMASAAITLDSPEIAHWKELLVTL